MKIFIAGLFLLWLAVGYFMWAAATVAGRADDANPYLKDEGDDEKRPGDEPPA